MFHVPLSATVLAYCILFNCALAGEASIWQPIQTSGPVEMAIGIKDGSGFYLQTSLPLERGPGVEQVAKDQLLEEVCRLAGVNANCSMQYATPVVTDDSATLYLADIRVNGEPITAEMVRQYKENNSR